MKDNFSLVVSKLTTVKMCMGESKGYKKQPIGNYLSIGKSKLGRKFYTYDIQLVQF